MAMPKEIDEILTEILKHADTEGLFRKAGSKLRVEELRRLLEAQEGRSSDLRLILVLTRGLHGLVKNPNT